MFFKLSFEEFKVLDAPDLIINIWLYNDPKNTGYFCCIYSVWCEIALKEKWKEEWGDFDFTVKKIRENDKNFIDVRKYSSEDRYLIIDELIDIKNDPWN